MVSDSKRSDGCRVCFSDNDLSPPPSLLCQILSAGFPWHLPRLAWLSGHYELHCFDRSLQGLPPLWALACWSLDCIHPPVPGEGLLTKEKSADLITANGRQNAILNSHSHTCILAIMSATLTMGSWVIASLLCAFILLFIQPILSFMHFSTVLFSSALKCRYRSSWERVCDKKCILYIYISIIATPLII